MKSPALCLMLAIMLPVAVQAGEFYKCTINGQVRYQATPCPQGSGNTVELLPISSMSGTAPTSGTRNPASSSVAAPAATPAVGAAYNSGTWYRGAPGYRLALAESRRTGAPIFVYFFVDWCGYCKRVDGTVLPDAKVTAKLRNFIKVRINPEKHPEDDKLFAALGGRGYPFALTGQGEGKLTRFNFGGYTPADTLAGLDQVMGGIRR